MRKESDEDDEFFDRTMEPKGLTQEEKDKYKTEAKDQSYEQLKYQLENLMAEKQELNENMLKIALGARKDVEEVQDELDAYLKNNEKELKDNQKLLNIERMKKLTERIDELTNLLKFVQPSFNFFNFEKDRLKQIEKERLKAEQKQKEKEQRRMILQKMEQRNEELRGKEKMEGEHQEEEWDELEHDEELATLGKRAKRVQEALPEDKGPIEKKVYGVSLAPVSRDEPEEEIEERGEELEEEVELPLPIVTDKQKASGY
jgi:hypothetical protein